MPPADTLMSQVFARAEQILVDVGTELVASPAAMVERMIRVHAWRDKTYVGVNESGTVSVWRGRSLNLSSLDDRYGCLYIDLVRNDLRRPEREELFGTAFALVIEGFDTYVVVFMSDFLAPTSVRDLPRGVVPRTMKRGQHLCRI